MNIHRASGKTGGEHSPTPSTKVYLKIKTDIIEKYELNFNQYHEYCSEKSIDAILRERDFKKLTDEKLSVGSGYARKSYIGYVQHIAEVFDFAFELKWFDVVQESDSYKYPHEFRTELGNFIREHIVEVSPYCAGAASTHVVNQEGLPREEAKGLSIYKASDSRTSRRSLESGTSGWKYAIWTAIILVSTSTAYFFGFKVNPSQSTEVTPQASSDEPNSDASNVVFLKGEAKAATILEIQSLIEDARTLSDPKAKNGDPFCIWAATKLQDLVSEIDTRPIDDFHLRLGQIKTYLSVLNKLNETGVINGAMLSRLPGPGVALYPQILIHRGYIKIMAGRNAEAEFLAAWNLPFDRESELEILFGLGESYLQQEKVDLAKEKFEELIKSIQSDKPGNDEVLCKTLLRVARIQLNEQDVLASISTMENLLDRFAEVYEKTMYGRSILICQLSQMTADIWLNNTNPDYQNQIDGLRQTTNQFVTQAGYRSEQTLYQPIIDDFLLAVIRLVDAELELGLEYSAEQLKMAQRIIDTPSVSGKISALIKTKFDILAGKILERTLPIPENWQATVDWCSKVLQNNSLLSGDQKSNFAFLELESRIKILNYHFNGPSKLEAEKSPEFLRRSLTLLDWITSLPQKFEPNVEEVRNQINSIIENSSQDSLVYEFATALESKLDSMTIKFIEDQAK